MLGNAELLWSQTTDTQWRHTSKKSENLGQCGRQKILRAYLKIWDWDLIFGRAVKAISSLGVRSPWVVPYKPQKFPFHMILLHWLQNQMTFSSTQDNYGGEVKNVFLCPSAAYLTTILGTFGRAVVPQRLINQSFYQEILLLQKLYKMTLEGRF